MIALLTDFGLDDIYVGVMKSVILSIDPSAGIVDLSHSIAPQSIAMGSFALAAAWQYLPKDAIVVGVVDPGVGTDRRAVALMIEKRIFVGPDNGLISRVADSYPITHAAELTNTQLHLPQQKRATFHGRDIFAPVAAHLHKGMSIAETGDKVDPSTLVRVTSPPFHVTDQEITCTVLLIDHFGNIITNIPHNVFAGRNGGAMLLVTGSSEAIPIFFAPAYGAGKLGELSLIPTSFGTMEIAVRNGSAAEMLRKTAPGDRVTIRLDKTNTDGSS